MSSSQSIAADVVVIGGGAAGLAGALMLARSRRSVVVVDGGDPRNGPAAGVHAFLTRDGTPPATLLAVAREEVAGYGATILAGRVASTRGELGAGFTVELEDGREVRGRRLLVATGLRDELPDVPGVAQRWGREVIHCPYCHGWEVRDQRIAVLATGPMAEHQALLFSQLSASVTLLVNTAGAPEEAMAARLAARGVRIVEGVVASLDIDPGADRLVGVRLASGRSLPCDAVVVGPRFAARVEMLAGLGLEAVDHPSGMGTHVVAAPQTGATEVPGVFAAGNVTDPMLQVLPSAAAGSAVGAYLNVHLLEEDVAAAMVAS